MARREKQSSKTTQKKRASHSEKLAFLSQFKRVPDPTNKSSVSRQYRELNRFAHLHRAADRESLAAAKARGFFTTDKGVIIDGPRDGKRNRIPGAKMRLNKDGTVVWSVKSRRDLIIGLTRAEKKEFAKDPKAFSEKKLAELRKTNPTLKSVPASRIQTRLQWGAYQAQKDFAPDYFARLTTWQQFRAMYGVGRSRKKGDVDRLTGFHFTVHLSKRVKRHANKQKTKRRKAR